VAIAENASTWTPIYAAAGIFTGYPLIAPTTPIWNPYTNQFDGVVAAPVGFSWMEGEMNETNPSPNSRCAVLDMNGNVISSSGDTNPVQIFGKTLMLK
jgi:hypothetical protein